MSDEEIAKQRISIGHPPLAGVLAHCRNPCCDGQAQERIDGVIEIVEILYVDLLGESGSRDPRHNMVDRSSTHVRAVHESDMRCPVCGGERELTTQVRPVYSPLSGYRQDYLTQIRRHGSVEAAQISMTRENTRRLAALEAFAASEAAVAAAEKPKPKGSP